MECRDPKGGEESKKSKSQQYERYNMKIPEAEDVYGSEYGSEDEETKDKSAEKEKEKENQLYAPAALMEEVDAILGIQNEEYAVFEKEN